MLQVHEPTQRPSARIRGYVFWLTADGKHGLVAETQIRFRLLVWS
jgi:hypothetical protein